MRLQKIGNLSQLSLPAVLICTLVIMIAFDLLAIGRGWSKPQDAQSLSMKYFPSTFDDIRRRWYSENLAALKEPSLFGANEDSLQEVYRFTWLRSFHNPISVRIERSRNNVSITLKKAAGMRGSNPGKLSLQVHSSMSLSTFADFKKRLEKSKFWKLGSTSRKEIGLDGSIWIFEARDGSRYNIVDRWSPKEGALHELGLYMLEQAGALPISKKEIY